MDIPSTPEALFETLAEPMLRKMFPNFDELDPRNQKLIHLLQTELTKGELSDMTFQEFVGFTVILWRSFNRVALEVNQDLIESEPEIDTDWVEAAMHLARMDQFLADLFNAVTRLPGYEDGGSEAIRNAKYTLRGPGDC